MRLLSHRYLHLCVQKIRNTLKYINRYTNGLTATFRILITVNGMVIFTVTEVSLRTLKATNGKAHFIFQECSCIVENCWKE